MNRQCRRATNCVIPMSLRVSATLHVFLTMVTTRRTTLATAQAVDRLLLENLVPIKRKVSVIVLSWGNVLFKHAPTVLITVMFPVHLLVHRECILVLSGHLTPRPSRVCRTVL